jgi:hypothetical protein
MLVARSEESFVVLLFDPVPPCSEDNVHIFRYEEASAIRMCWLDILGIDFWIDLTL